MADHQQQWQHSEHSLGFILSHKASVRGYNEGAVAIDVCNEEVNRISAHAPVESHSGANSRTIAEAHRVEPLEARPRRGQTAHQAK